MKIEDLPRPANYRRQMAKNGGYEMVPAYTAEEVLGILEGVRCEPVGWLVDGVYFYLVQQLDRQNRPIPNQVALGVLADAPTIDAAIQKGQV